MNRFLVATLLLSSLPLSSLSWGAEIRLWPANAPGDTPEEAGLQEKELPTEEGAAPLLRISDVSVPTLQHFAPEGKSTGACALICPGGGYNIVAYEHEGTAVAKWFNSIGVHAVVLKYRVPRRVDRDIHEAPLQDAQRAMGLIQGKASSWGIDPQRIGVLGFSAGGNLASWLAASHTERSYLAVDAADENPCRPAFAFLLYPAYIAGSKIVDGSSPLGLFSKNMPPVFIALANNDPHAGSGAAVYARLLEVGASVEIHAYAEGGHGFGYQSGATGLAASTWSKPAADWFAERGFRQPLPEPKPESQLEEPES